MVRDAVAGGFDHLGALRRELRGNQRALEIHFNEIDDLRKEGFEPQLLWQRGDPLEQARARLAALAPDPSAQRAARDTVHPLLAEVEKLIPRPARQEFSLFVWAGWLDAKLVELPPQQAANGVTRRRFAEQWSESNPRFRAAHAAASYLEREGRGVHKYDPAANRAIRVGPTEFVHPTGTAASLGPPRLSAPSPPWRWSPGAVGPLARRPDKRARQATRASRLAHQPM